MLILARAPEGSGPVPRPARPRLSTRLQRGPLAPTLALVAGIAAALGFAPIGIFAFTLFGLAALIVLCEAAPRRAAPLGFIWGTGHFGFGVRWVAEAFTYQDKMPHWLGWPVVLALAALLATMPAIACALVWRIFYPPLLTSYPPPSGGGTARSAGRGSATAEQSLHARTTARLYAFPAAWMATEWLRGHLFTGFPWNTLAASTLDIPGLALPAALYGALGLSGLIALAAAAIAYAKLWPGVVAATLAIVGTAAALLSPPAPTPRPVQLVIVQPNISQADKWDPSAQARNLDTLMRLSRTASPTRDPRVILWPEAALAEAEPETDPALRTRLATLLRPGDLLLTGGLSARYDRAGTPVAATNSVFVIDSAGAIRARYDKSHLVPGGEYVPLRPIADALGLSRLAPGDVDFTPGSGPRTIILPGIPPVGALICYEMIFPTAIVDEAHRPGWLFNPSNDAWFADTGPWQHLALARLRAIEEGLPIARSTPTGVSALIGANGAILATLPQRTPGVIVQPLPAPGPRTPFSRAGDLIPLALGLLALGLSRRAAHRT